MDEAPHERSGGASFTPFVPTLGPAVEAALEALLGQPLAAWEDRARHRPGDPLAVLARLGGVPPLEIELVTPTPTERVFARGKRLALTYRSLPGGADPAATPAGQDRLEELRARLARAERTGTEIAALVRALTDKRRFGAVHDWMYRQGSEDDSLLRLGFRCNQDCSFCWQGRDWPEPPDALYHTWLREIAAAGYRRVSFSGGEPTLHRALPGLIEEARALGVVPWIQTNAIQLSKPGLLARLTRAGLFGAFVSYHSADPAISDRMTRAPGTHPRTEAGIAAAIGAGVHVVLNCVVERQNYLTLAAHAEAVLGRFVEPFPAHPAQKVVYSHPCHAYDAAQWRASVVPLAEVAPPLVDALVRLRDRGVPVEAIGTCGFPPCLLRDRPELLAWLVPGSLPARELSGRVYAPACGACAVKTRCLGLRREYVDLLGAEGVRPFATDPARP